MEGISKKPHLSFELIMFQFSFYFSLFNIPQDDSLKVSRFLKLLFISGWFNWMSVFDNLFKDDALQGWSCSSSSMWTRFVKVQGYDFEGQWWEPGGGISLHFCLFSQRGHTSSGGITGHTRSESQGTRRPFRTRLQFPSSWNIRWRFARITAENTSPAPETNKYEPFLLI